MATQFDLDCALMAGASYISTRADINRFPIPDGWEKITNPDSHFLDQSSGFEAVSFQNISNPNEIVISFAGTNPRMFDPDWVADFGLTTGFSCAQQLKEAAAYYLEIKKANKDNPNITISFTGHSLGGGLAALLGVFFDKKAVTFDQAPFAKSAKESIRNELVTYLNGLYSPEELATLAPELFFFTNSDLASREGKVSGFYVKGEVLSVNLPSWTIGNQKQLTQGAPADNLAFQISLHSQTLLTAFLQNDAFLKVTDKLPDMVKMLFDERLFAHDPSKLVDPKRNFLEGLIQHQTGASGDDMLGRFTADLQLVAQDGGLTMSNNDITKALIAFAMQKYDNEQTTGAGAGTKLFSNVGMTGGIHFDRTNVAATLDGEKDGAIGYKGTDMDKMFTAYLNSLSLGGTTDVLKHQLPNLLDWYIQAGKQAMTATAGDQRAFMLGGSGNDTLTGGSQADVLVGNGGKDTLTGGGGDDVLMGGTDTEADILSGGAGYDTYYAAANDTINDSDHSGVVYFNGNNVGDIAFKFAYADEGGEYYRGTSSNETVKYDVADNTLTYYLNGIVTIENYTRNDFGITLTKTELELPPANQTMAGTAGNDNTSVQLWLDTLNPKTGVYGNFSFYSFAEAPSFIYSGDTSPPNLEINGGSGNDELFGLAGSDVISGGSGNDLISGEINLLNDNPGYYALLNPWGQTGQSDILKGEAGKDVILAVYGDDFVSGGDDNDFVDGGAGNDTLGGDNGNDVVLGSVGDDFIAGGSGDDILGGDLSFPDYIYNRGGGNFTPADIAAMNFQMTYDPDRGYPTSVTYANFELVENAESGNDTIFGGSGNDYILGGGGRDMLFGEEDNDTLFGGAGNDWNWRMAA